MASSDDEGEAVPDIVSNYYLVNDKNEPVSFSELPVQWNDGDGLDGKGKQIFLHGTSDNGLQTIYKQVRAWKCDISEVQPEIMVLSKESSWIKLQKPRKSFEDTIRTILITVHCLHFAKKNPEMSGRSLWDHLSKVFSLYETRPSENDLIDQINLISEAVEKDETLAKSKFLVTFLEEKPKKKRAFDEDIGSTKPGFIVDDDVMDNLDDDDDEEEDDDLYDSVCAICDNGGDILCCEGRCMRSFHATVDAGTDSACESLGFTSEQVDAIQNFFCKNCQFKQHQCFACGELGSSDKLSGAEVFPCVSATCGRFYHPHCVAKLLHRDSEAQAEELQKKIAAGESFTCPIHKCIVCKQGENKMDPDLQFAVCRRCPKSYHRKCLPRKIAFEDNEDEGIMQRAWEDLIPNRILIYCLKHEIDDEIGTPIRNHLKFPGDGQKKKKQASEQLARKEKVLQKDRTLASADAPRKRTLEKLQKGAEGGSSKKTMTRLMGPDSSKKQKVGDISRKPVKSSASTQVIKPNDGPSLGDRLFDFMTKRSESFKSRKDTPDSEHMRTPTDKPVAKERSDSLPLDEDSKKRVMALVKDATSSITQEKIIEKYRRSMTHGYSSKHVVDKAITLGKVEGSVEAIRAALQKLEEGCSGEDAKAVCQPELLNQMLRWKNKLKVYLAPFLYGMRYTSFGRHFTKVDKLKEIVDVLHCYVQEGDMIVDFCCGANDFSWLMKEKLDQIGIRCSYKNYDLFQAKNDFNFEKRDWMSVEPKELPTGSQLIMGLNPPFGVNSGLANKFIDKALEFKPKLLILIVPPETERLDKKKSPYDLVWQDDELLVGKSFYLPGSVDVNDNQLEDWNMITPPLYLWSRPDWTAKHKAIAQQHGHLSRVHDQPNLEDRNEMSVSDLPLEFYDPISQCPVPMDLSMDDPLVQNEVYKQLQERANVSEGRKEVLPCDGDREANVNTSQGKNHSNDGSKKRRRGKGKHGRESCKPSPEIKEMTGKMPHHSPPNGTHERSLDACSFEPMEVGEGGHRHFERTHSHHQSGTRADDHVARRYGSNREEPILGGNHRSSTGPSPNHGGPDYGIMNRGEPNSGGTPRWPSGHSPIRGGHEFGITNREERYLGGTHRWPNSASPGHGGPDYGVRNLVDQFPGYNRPYTSEIEEKYALDSAIRSHSGHYGQPQYPYPNAFGQRNSYLSGGDPGFSSSYGHLGPAPGPSYDRMNTTTSAMERYAPRLDEMNYTRMNPLASMPPPMAGRNVIPDPLAQQPGYRIDSTGFASAPQPGYRIDSTGFASAPYNRLFSPQNSSGWLND